MDKSILPNPSRSTKHCVISSCSANGKIVRGMCLKHYQRWKKYGYVVADLTEAHFWIQINKNGPMHPTNPNLGQCWIWKGASKEWKKGAGYGRICVNGKEERVHRYSWFLAHKKWPSLWVLHSCDNGMCVNPDHLREGTPKDNVQDMLLRGRCPQGEAAGAAIYTNKQIHEVCRLMALGYQDFQIEQKTNILYATIHAIRKGRQWKCIARKWGIGSPSGK